MLSNLNLKTKTLKIISLSLTLTGITFILASEYIGSISIRLAMLITLAFCLTNIKMTYKYLTTKEKINYFAAVTASILGLVKPELTMFIIGIMLLFLTVPIYFNAIKSKDYSDIIMIIVSGIGILFAIYCIINSEAALNTVIIIIGIAFTILGCLTLYETFNTTKINPNYYEQNDENQFGFTNTNDI
ncbi:MAG: hypothetical protein SA378_04650 [Sedimentibacter sp.]|uniref:hypothetical protein n=1 Tax=Sedimentibacter sp. TaxID=1960295 RepID=UPI0029823FB0|nr:hypothetical protein [Sedimentibacter sp.]MDW5299410.1 hypothetical protein [Sedimentibacter sp.]